MGNKAKLAPEREKPIGVLKMLQNRGAMDELAHLHAARGLSFTVIHLK